MQTPTGADVPIFTAVDTAQDVHSVSKIRGCHHKVGVLTSNNWKLPLQPMNAALLGHYFTALIWSVSKSAMSIIMNKGKKIIRKCQLRSHWNNQEFDIVVRSPFPSSFVCILWLHRLHCRILAENYSAAKTFIKFGG